MNGILDLQAARLRAARRRTLAFAEIALAVFMAVEQHVRLPSPALPELDVPPEPGPADVATLARQARRRLGVPTGPVPNMVRLLEAHGVAVVRFDHDETRRVRTFSHHGHRPIVLLDASGRDKARDRFDSARELGHLLMHPRPALGLRSGPAIGRQVDQQVRAERRAHAFAAEFLAPAEEIAVQLPTRLDWAALHDLKRRWGIGLAELVERARDLGRFGEADSRRALAELADATSPEHCPLGPLEAPVLLPRSLDLLGRPAGDLGATAVPGQGGLPGDVLADLALEACLPLDVVQHVARAAGAGRRRPDVALELHV